MLFHADMQHALMTVQKQQEPHLWCQQRVISSCGAPHSSLQLSSMRARLGKNTFWQAWGLQADDSSAHAGAEEVTAEEGSVRQEPGAGISGQVQGHRVAVGSLEWVQQSSSTELPGARPQADSTVAGQEPDLPPGHSAVYVSVDGKVAALLHVADTMRPDARETVEALQHRGIRVAMLSGA